jgi:hypothetical protein
MPIPLQRAYPTPTCVSHSNTPPSGAQRAAASALPKDRITQPKVLQHSTQGSSTLNPQLHGILDSNMRPWFKNASAYSTSTCLSHSNVPIPHQHAYPIPTLHPAVLNPQLHGTLDSNMRPWFQNASAYSTSTCVSNFSMPIPLQHTALLRVALLLGVYV